MEADSVGGRGGANEMTQARTTEERPTESETGGVERPFLPGGRGGGRGGGGRVRWAT